MDDVIINNAKNSIDNIAFADTMIIRIFQILLQNIDIDSCVDDT
jgi:hypothetical protein